MSIEEEPRVTMTEIARGARVSVPTVFVDPVGGAAPGAPTIGTTNWAGGLSATEHLLSLGHRRIGFVAGPRRLLCGRARVGYGAGLEAAVYEAARRLGLRVPGDVSVVGFDDLPQARWSSPPLTTVRQPLSQMGVLAARTILRLARGEEIESPRLELATELVVRDSTAPPR